MPFNTQGGTNGGLPQSPGGHEFGLQGWSWPDPVPRGITFFIDNTAMVTDQFGRAIRGAEIEGQRVYFAIRPPQMTELNPGSPDAKIKLATHAEVIAALVAERIDWVKLSRAGWPQIPYEELKKLPLLPPWPFDDVHAPTSTRACNCLVCGIRDPKIRKDALRARTESLREIQKQVEEAHQEMNPVG